MPNNKVIAAVKQKYNNYTNYKVINTLLILNVILSSFIFNSKFNQQIKDSPAGTICAPAYINIFVSELEEKLIYLLITDESISYVRFINDILGDGLHERRNYILHK